MVWDDELEHRHRSRYQGEKEAPDLWNQPGNEFNIKAVDELNAQFAERVKKAVAHIPQDLLIGCIHQ